MEQGGLQHHRTHFYHLPENCVDNILSWLLHEPRGADTLPVRCTSSALMEAVKRTRGFERSRLYLGPHHLTGEDAAPSDNMFYRLSRYTSLSLLVNDHGAYSGNVAQTGHHALLNDLGGKAWEAVQAAKTAAAADGSEVQPLPLRELLVNSHLMAGADGDSLSCVLPWLVDMFPNLERLGFCMTIRWPGMSKEQHRKQQAAELKNMQQLLGLTSLVLFTPSYDDDADAVKQYQGVLPIILRRLAWRGDHVCKAQGLDRLVNLRHLWLRHTDTSFVEWGWLPQALLTRLERLGLAVTYLTPDWFTQEALAALAPILVDLELGQLWAKDITPLLQLSALTSLTALCLRQPILRLPQDWDVTQMRMKFGRKGMCAPWWRNPGSANQALLAASLQRLPSLKLLALHCCTSMKPILQALPGFPVLQQLRLDPVDPYFLCGKTYLTGIKGLTRLELTSNVSRQQLEDKGPPRWDLILAPLTGLEYLQVEPRMLVAGEAPFTWLSQLSFLHTLAITAPNQLVAPSALKGAWVPRGPVADWAGDVDRLSDVVQAVWQLWGSLEFLVLHGFLDEEVVEALRGALQPGMQLVHEPRSAAWLRAVKF